MRNLLLEWPYVPRRIRKHSRGLRFDPIVLDQDSFYLTGTVNNLSYDFPSAIDRMHQLLISCAHDAS
jgi:hypothetical protein